MNKVKVEEKNGELQVFTPYSSDFVTQARSAGGKWSSSRKCWLFDARSMAVVKDILISCYGTDGTPCELVSIKITAKKNIIEYSAGIEIMGRPIARASGRDSGARVGDGVSLLTGVITSGGSIKNWATKINEGTEIIMHDMPKSVLEHVFDDWNVEIYEVTPSRIDRTVLIAELQQIEARAVQIKELLDAAQPRPDENLSGAQAKPHPVAVSLQMGQAEAKVYICRFKDYYGK